MREELRAEREHHFQRLFSLWLRCLYPRLQPVWCVSRLPPADSAEMCVVLLERQLGSGDEPAVQSQFILVTFL